MELRLGWSRALAVLAIAVAVALALVAFQYFVVFGVLVGFSPDQPESFTSKSSLDGAAAVNFLACVAAASIPVLVAAGLRWREHIEDKTIGLSVSLLIALPLGAWALVSSFGLLLGSALAD